MAQMLRDEGWIVNGCWSSLDDAVAQASLAEAGLLVASHDLMVRNGAGRRLNAIMASDSHQMIVVLEPGEALPANEFIELEVDGLILSSASREQLRECLAIVGKGRQWIDPGIRHLLTDKSDLPPAWEELSSRELEVAKLASEGLRNKEIARSLLVTEGTVKMHMHHVLSKLHLSSRVDLVWAFPDIFKGNDLADHRREISNRTEKMVEWSIGK